jgi:subtilisin family serine protease
MQAADTPFVRPNEVADAIVECVNAGVRVLNLSVATAQPSSNREQKLENALSYAANRETIVVAAAGNQASLGSSAITRHPAVVPVAACNREGLPMSGTNLGGSLAKRGLMAPGERITSLASGGGFTALSGTSAAAPFVTGALALLWSIFPSASATALRLAVLGGFGRRRTSVVPRLLNVLEAYNALAVTDSSIAHTVEVISGQT